jgi:2-keto-4-pentenoate hydratase
VIDLKQRIIELANLLKEAEDSRVGILPLTKQEEKITIDDAYHIQLENVKRKVEAGHTISGKKIGLTSLAMQRQLGVGEPDYGHLLDSMQIENQGVIPKNKILQPKVEAEIAFVLNKDLKGPKVTALDVLLATDYIVPALEIVDSRIKDWKIQLEDTVADNASSGFYVLGEKRVKLTEVNLELLGMVFSKNGRTVNTGVGAAALGNPAVCVAWLANKLAQYGSGLYAGEVILSGALSASAEAKEGDEFTARFAHLGEVHVRF